MTAQPRLTDRIVLVTGGTSGIGRSTAERFHAEGATVVVTGATEDSAARARAELPSGVTVVVCDVRTASAITSLVEGIRERHGRLDVLFLNAGIASLSPFEGVDEGAFDREFDVNVKGLFFTLQRALPLLVPGSSVIVNTSVAAHKGVAGMSLYSATKGAVSSLVRALAVELAPRGIRVNALAPATIATPIQAKFGLPEELQQQVQKDTESRIPLGRFGSADEVAEVALFLADRASSYVTGAELRVDGGFSAA